MVRKRISASGMILEALSFNHSPGAFGKVEMSPRLMEGSKFMTAANLVAGKNVPIVITGGRPLLVSPEKILRRGRSVDQMASTDIVEVDAGATSSVLKPYLCGGFF